MKLDLVRKITLSGILLVMVILFTRFFSIQNIPILPFVRISLGPALIIFSSLLLGPLFGGIIGGLSDILGIILVPNALGISINPYFIIIYTLLGVLPYLIYKMLKKIRNLKFSFIILLAVFSILFVFVNLYLFLQDNIIIGGNNFNLLIWQKIVISSSVLLLFILNIFYIKHLQNKFKSKENDNVSINVYSISITCVICEFIIMLLLNSIVKSVFFEVDFLFILCMQSIIFFVDVPLNILCVSYLMKFTSKWYKIII